MNGMQISDRLFHHPRAFHDLRQEHFAGAEQIADDTHAGHERAFDDIQRAFRFLARFLGVGINVIHNTLDQRVLQAFLDR